MINTNSFKLYGPDYIIRIGEPGSCICVGITKCTQDFLIGKNNITRFDLNKLTNGVLFKSTDNDKNIIYNYTYEQLKSIGDDDSNCSCYDCDDDDKFGQDFHLFGAFHSPVKTTEGII